MRHEEPGIDAGVEAAGELHRLRVETAAARKARDMALDELLALQDVINRVSAVCDMAEWAADVAGVEGPAAVPVQDLRQALRPQGSGSGGDR